MYVSHSLLLRGDNKSLYKAELEFILDPALP